MQAELQRPLLGMVVTVWLIPFLLAAPADGAPSRSIRLVDVLLSDNADDDGIADSNETVQVRLQLENVSGYDLTGVVARLVSADPSLACVTRPLIAIPPLAVGQVLLTDAAFEFRLADVQRSGQCSETQTLCWSEANCEGGAGTCNAPYVDFAANFSVVFTSEQFAEQSPAQTLSLGLDLDVWGGAGSTTFFEGFETAGFDGFTSMNLDAGRHGLTESDGFRCQYNDPIWINSNSYGVITDCFMGATALQADAYHWQIDDPLSADGGRAFGGLRSLYMGLFLPDGLGHTTPMGALEAAGTSSPIHLGWNQVCSITITTRCTDDFDCPPGESCVIDAPTLSIKHQVSLLDHRTVNARVGRTGDRAVVQAQMLDAAGGPAGDWIKLQPHLNVYDSQAEDNYTNCTFDPVDDGNDEDDYFDDTDPYRRLGPSSTCFPEYVFSHLGDTDEPFDSLRIGNASHGPGLAGAVGPGTWVESLFDLSRFRGRSVRLRFLSTSLKAGSFETWEQIFEFNPDPGDDGWWIDDVTVSNALVDPATLAADTSNNSGFPPLPDGDSDGAADACDNCPVYANSGQDDADGDLIGDICDVCPFDALNDIDGDAYCCDADNCCFVANPLQEDADGDGAGDLCDVDPVVLVSKDPTDNPDFDAIQAAVDLAVQSGTRIRIMPGTYTEQVELDRNMVFFIEGVEDGSGEPVIVDGSFDAAFDFRSRGGTINATMRNLTIRGSTGVRSAIPLTVEHCTFEQNSVTAVDLGAPGSAVRWISATESTTTRGVWVRPGASATVEHVRLQNLSGNGMRIAGPTAIRNSLITGCVAGLVITDDADTVEVEHTTIADNIDGIDSSTSASVHITSTILADNTSWDFFAVDCSRVSWSLLNDVDCSAALGNLRGDPLLGPDYHLAASSLAIDHGPEPSTYAGVPCTDLNGQPRLRDHTGDGLAYVDIGAFERENTTQEPTAASGVVWADKETMTWNDVTSAQQFHVYRGTLSALGFDDYGSCRDDLLAKPKATPELTDTEQPAPGQGLHYQVTVEESGEESTRGVGTCAERSNFSPCP